MMAAQSRVDYALAGDAGEISRHASLAEQVATAGQGRVVPPAYRDAAVANASPWLVVAGPIMADGKAVAVVEIFQRAEPRPSVQEGYLQVVSAACAVGEQVYRSEVLQHAKQREQSLALLADYLTRIHRDLELAQVGAAIVNESRRITGCDRVSLLARPARKDRVIAISGVESFDRKSPSVRGLEALARQLRHEDQALRFPEQADEVPPAIAEQVQQLMDESHAKFVTVLPIAHRPGEAEEAELIGLLVAEQFSRPFSTEQQKIGDSLARCSGPALANAIVYDRIPLRRFMQWLAALLGIAPGQRWSPAAAVAIALAVVALLLAVVPADFTIEARGELVPSRRQNIFAPSDGIVLKLPRREGDQVKAGELLAQLHSPNLDIEESELVGKQRTVQEELRSVETAALDSERDPTGQTSRERLSARSVQLKEELRGLQAQIAVVRQQQQALAIASPLAGTIISWDREQELADRPVKRGDLLMTVADLSGPWEALLDVADRRAGHVVAAHRANPRVPVSFQLGSDPGNQQQGEIASLSPATQLSVDGEPSVRVTVEPDETAKNTSRPGATVVARIHCGRRSLGYVWLHEIWENIRLRLFL
jgi:multidrug efflux pump subunit AcrA (membrane-fusion protein)